MAETHEQWLARLTERSKAAQQTFMDGIAERLGHPRMTTKPAHPFRGAPDFWNEMEWPLEEKAQQFTDNFLSVGGHVSRLGSMEEAAAFIAGKAKEMSARYLVRQDEPELAALGLEAALPDVQVSVWNSDAEPRIEADASSTSSSSQTAKRQPDGRWKAQAAQADFGVVRADHAVAYTGSVTVLSSKEKGRSVSLLPTVLFIIIPVERLKTRLGEVLTQFDEAGRERLPAGIHFISGPSRSSDIENDLTIGVHGPGIVYALLVG